MSLHTKTLLRLAVVSLTLLVTGGPASAETIAITGATVHTLGPLGSLDNATIVIENGVITAIGDRLTLPAGAQKIDGSGKVVTPGIFDAYASLGLVEISLVEETVDAIQGGENFGASFTLGEAINPRSSVIPVNRVEGVTRAVVVPAATTPASPAEAGSIFSGQGAYIHLGGGTNYLLSNGIAMVAYLGEDGAALSGGSRARAMQRLRLALDDAVDFASNEAAYDAGQRRQYSLSRGDLIALQPVLSGEMPLLIHANRASDIEAIIRLSSEYRLVPVIVGAVEAWLVAGELAAAKIPVIVYPTRNLPSSFDRLAATLEAPARLHRAGVLQAFAIGDSHNSRNLTQEAGNAVAHGMPWLDALKAITLNPATIYGVADSAGSLATGMKADLVVWSGDPLEVTTFADTVFIGGKRMNMTSRQTLLRDRYLKLDDTQPAAYR